MKIKRITTAFCTAVILSCSVFLASCGDADGDGNVPMDDDDNGGGVVDDVEKMADDAANSIRRNRNIPYNSINKAAPDSANINA